MAVYPIQTTTQDNVLAAQLRATLNNGKEWGVSGSTLATVSDLNALSNPSAADLTTVQGIASKVNTILALLRNLNV